VRPLLSEGRRVLVDGHAICAECGVAVEAVAGGEWRHGLTRRPRLEPTHSFAEFTRRFPWVSTSEGEWRDATRILGDYENKLKTFARRKRLAAGENPYLDLFRGLMMGYWLALLRARGVDAVGYDARRPGRSNAYHRGARRPWAQIERRSSVAAARSHRDRSLLLCWPPYDDDAASFEVLRAYRGDVVIHIGEIASGSVRFHRELALNWTLVEELELPHWPRIQDRVMVYRRNAVQRAHIERDRCFECKKFIPTGAIGRCDECFRRRPPALALRVGRHRMEYPQHVVDAMPPALRKAFEASPALIKSASYRRPARG
jgi:hypothetical protein